MTASGARALPDMFSALSWGNGLMDEVLGITHHGRPIGLGTLLELVGNPPLLPDELWFQVFQFLDVSDIMNCSLVSIQFRHVALSKQLLIARLHNTAKWLDIQYPQRPTSRELYERHILLSSSPSIGISHLKLSIKLQKTLRKDALKRGLERRPTEQELVGRGILKPGGALADRMLALERQRNADAIRQFYNSSQRPSLEEAIRRGVVQPVEDKHRPVSLLTRMFSYRIDGRPTKHMEAPPRAKVYKMRRKFEQLARESQLDMPSCAQPLRKQLTGVTSGAVAAIRQKFLTVS